MTTPFIPFREPLRSTLTRTIGIAVVGASVLALASGRVRMWPLLVLLMLWPSFGGHWLDVLFLNGLRPLLPPARAAQVAARVLTWFAGGTLLALGAALTAEALAGVTPERWPSLWLGGAVFIGVELVAHLALQLRGRPSFYSGRG